MMDELDPEWVAECIKWRGVVLTGKKAHYCYDLDSLPVDETTSEIDSCHCWDNVAGTKERR